MKSVEEKLADYTTILKGILAMREEERLSTEDYIKGLQVAEVYTLRNVIKELEKIK